MENTDKELINAAKNVRELAYTPYSNFKVGAAVRTKDGKIYTGCNVESASYGLTVCAQSVAILESRLRGRKRIYGNRHRCRYSRTHAAVRSLPANHLGILRRHSRDFRQSKRQYGNRPNERTSAKKLLIQSF